MSRKIIIPASSFIEEHTIVIKSCDELGLEHAWETYEDNIEMFPFIPDSPYNFPQRRCLNCGKWQLHRVIQREIKEWVDI